MPPIHTCGHSRSTHVSGAVVGSLVESFEPCCRTHDNPSTGAAKWGSHPVATWTVVEPICSLIASSLPDPGPVIKAYQFDIEFFFSSCLRHHGHDIHKQIFIHSPFPKPRSPSRSVTSSTCNSHLCKRVCNSKIIILVVALPSMSRVVPLNSRFAIWTKALAPPKPQPNCS